MCGCRRPISTLLAQAMISVKKWGRHAYIIATMTKDKSNVVMAIYLARAWMENGKARRGRAANHRKAGRVMHNNIMHMHICA